MDFANREFLSQVKGSIEFTITSYDINPSTPQLFQILNQISRNFEIYKFHKLEFYYKSNTATSDNQAITSQGTCMFNITYDATTPPFTSKNEMMNYNGSISCKPSQSMKVSMTPMYRFKDIHPPITSATMETSDVRNTSPGTFNFATQGQADNTTFIGELFVYYEITLSKPRLYNTIGGNTLHYWAIVPKGTSNTWSGDTFTVPNNTSIMVNTLNCTWATANDFKIPVIDGAIVYIRMETILMVTGTVGTGFSDFKINNGQRHHFIPWEPSIYNTTSVNTPRQAEFGNTNNTFTNARLLNPAITITAARAGLRFGIEMMVKCRGNEPLTITTPTTNFLIGPYITHEVKLMNRPESFNQFLPNYASLYNPLWFQP